MALSTLTSLIREHMPQTLLKYGSTRPDVVLKRAKQCAFHAATSARKVRGTYGIDREFESERQAFTRALRLPANAHVLAELRPAVTATAKAA